MKQKKVVGIVSLVTGVAMLGVGVAFLVINLIQAGRLADGEFLVSAGDWVLEGEEGVVWRFSEVGKGTLTTNSYTNEYDFIWALEGKKLKVETEWLYDLENEYDYELDQGAKVLTLTDKEGTVKFRAR